MREIKFRAWANNQKKMYYDGFTINPEGGIASTFGIYEHNLTLMQYTGLKDKNDVEIFEGDIVKVYPAFISGDTEAVRWNEKIYGFSFGGYVLCQINFGKVFEVIGNIYENKELLGAE